MQSPTINNLSLMYYGIADGEMAKRLMEEHFLNPAEFWGEMPLPSVALNSPWLKKEEELGFCNLSHSLIYRRAIHALENYGYYAALTKLGKRFLAALESCNGFPRGFDPRSGEPTSKTEHYMPAASAALEFIKRFWGVAVDKETVCFGALGHEEGVTSEYHFVWGGDEYTVQAEQETTSGFISGKHLFTVTSGTRVFTDIYGMSPRVVNVTDRTLDCVFVHRNHTYSFTLEPDGVWEGAAPLKKIK